MSLANYLTTVLESIENNGYTFSGELRNFDSVASSRINKAYNFKVDVIEIEEIAGGRLQQKAEITLIIVEKLPVRGDKKAKYEDALTAIETIEKSVMNAITDTPLLMIEQTTEFIEDYVFFTIRFELVYELEL